eukprot:symbB.v1.2.038818.t1/scaffold6188.1/size20234/1
MSYNLSTWHGRGLGVYKKEDLRSLSLRTADSVDLQKEHEWFRAAADLCEITRATLLLVRGCPRHGMFLSYFVEMKQFFLSRLSATHTENDVLTVCLLSKQRQREWPEADIIGVRNLPDLWLVGYGLDDRGTKRGWTELFAIPKVKIVDTFDVEDVQRLMEKLDDNASLTGQCVFAGFELTYSNKQKYRVHGLDFREGPPRLKGSRASLANRVTKADMQKFLDAIPRVKGKFEHELQFSFIQENVALVPEDDIFAGNNKIFAEMRSSLRRQIQAAAERFGVKGLEDIQAA